MTTHRFKVAEYYRMGEPGLLSERTELIDGIIIDMEPIAPGTRTSSQRCNKYSTNKLMNEKRSSFRTKAEIR